MAFERDTTRYTRAVETSGTGAVQSTQRVGSYNHTGAGTLGHGRRNQLRRVQSGDGGEGGGGNGGWHLLVCPVGANTAQVDLSYFSIAFARGR